MQKLFPGLPHEKKWSVQWAARAIGSSLRVLQYNSKLKKLRRTVNVLPVILLTMFSIVAFYFLGLYAILTAPVIFALALALVYFFALVAIRVAASFDHEIRANLLQEFANFGSQ